VASAETPFTPVYIHPLGSPAVAPEKQTGWEIDDRTQNADAFKQFGRDAHLEAAPAT
jgi:hypothetical protein